MKKTLLAMTLVAGLIFPSPNKPFIESPTPLSNFIPETELKYQRIFYTDKMKELEKKIDDVINYRTNDFNNDSLQILVARTLLGEAEGCFELEKVAIAYTALNRATDRKEWNGKTLKEAILKSNQYSCFNKEKDSSIFLKNPLRHNKKEFLECLEIATKFLNGKYKDPTKGATSYANPNHPDLNGKSPDWGSKMTKIGRIKVGITKTGKPVWSKHIFYIEI
jgi:hypothetical protein